MQNYLLLALYSFVLTQYNVQLGTICVHKNRYALLAKFKEGLLPRKGSFQPAMTEMHKHGCFYFLWHSYPSVSTILVVTLYFEVSFNANRIDDNVKLQSWGYCKETNKQCVPQLWTVTPVKWVLSVHNFWHDWNSNKTGYIGFVLIHNINYESLGFSWDASLFL